MRDVSIDKTGSSVVRIVVGLAVTGLGIAALWPGLFANVDNGISLVGIGAVVVFIGVALLGPAIARPVSRAIGWPLVRVKGTTGALARENASRNPKRTSSTAAALMIGVALVGFITIFAASTKASISASIDRAFRADYVVNTEGRRLRRRVQPDAREAGGGAPGDRGPRAGSRSTASRSTARATSSPRATRARSSSCST